MDQGRFRKSDEFSSRPKAEDLKPAELDRLVGKRGPQKVRPRIPVSIRLSTDVVKHFKAKGPGWQSRIDEALRKIVKKAS